MLDEMNGGYRRSITDGRPLPEAPILRGKGIRRPSGTATRWSYTNGFLRSHL